MFSCYLRYFILIIYEKMDILTTLRLYKMKDILKSGFCIIKEKLAMRDLFSK